VADGALRYTVFIGETLLADAPRTVTSANGDYIVRRDLGSSVSFANAGSAFCFSVMLILSGSSQEQVQRPNTQRSIATVEHAQPVGDGAVRYLPRNTVGSLLFAAVHKHSVAVIPHASNPKPTTRRAIGEATESFTNIFGGCARSHA
jgi:hypothetical protein